LAWWAEALKQNMYRLLSSANRLAGLDRADSDCLVLDK